MAGDRRPLAVVVDDSASNVRQYRRAFEKRGCRVLSAANLNEAQDILFNTPGIDLVFTDINFNPPGQRANKDGVELAKLLRKKFDGGMPLVGCTGAFSELPREERELFDVTVGKAGRSPAQMRRLYDDCSTMAELRAAKRSVISDERLTELKRRYPNMDAGSIEHTERRANLNPTSIDEIEKEISDAGYELRLLQSDLFDELSQPVLIWYRNLDATVELEVYGHPVLYASAETDATAFEDLLGLMVGFQNDLKRFEDEGSEPIGPARQLAEFLRQKLS